MNLNKLWLLMVWLLLISSSRSIKAEDEQKEIELKKYGDVKVCGDNDDREFQISIGAGEIKNEDQFFGFTIDLTYDPEKIKFLSLLDKNTLSEFFEYKGYNVWEPGWIRAYATTLTMNNASGDKPLIAFLVKYIGECPDTTHINLDDIELEISQEFLDKLNNYQEKKIVVDVAVKEYNYSFVETGFVIDTLKEFQEDSTADIIVVLNTNGLEKVDSLDFEITYEINDVFDIKNISLLNEKMIIDTIYNTKAENKEKFVIKTNLSGSIENESILNIKMKRQTKINDTLTMAIDITGINYCTCATDLRGDYLTLLSKKDTSTYSVDNKIENNNYKIDVFYDIKNKEYIFKCEKEIKNIVIYNINGNKVKMQKFNNIKKEQRIDFSQFSDGVYMSHITLINDFEKNIVLIKN
jgi:hypothetical protein